MGLYSRGGLLKCVTSVTPPSQLRFDSRQSCAQMPVSIEIPQLQHPQPEAKSKVSF